MKIPLTWLNDFVDTNLELDDLARLLTMAGLEVDEIHLVGRSIPKRDHQEFRVNGLSWERDKIVVASISEVMPHPNADRLVLCKLDDGQQEHVVLTGAPNLYPFKGQGPLALPLKVAYAREGAVIYDGHEPGLVLTTLKRAKIRGVDSYSMVCSEKELGISEEHEGVILLDSDAPTGMPLVDYMGDAVFDISILPNTVRNANVLGVAREVAALTGQKLRYPQPKTRATGPTIHGQVSIQITDPSLNPRFIFGLVRGVDPQKPSPYWVQRRLRLAGMRPINGVVDATNYGMLEAGEPLHAFDYDVLVKRAGGKTPTIITRAAKQGEKLTTLENIERTLDSFSVLICDSVGSLSLAGVMGGLESEVTAATRNVLLEAASWNFINTRKTVQAQKLPSEAAYRFARGVHPELAPLGMTLGLDHIAQWSGGEIAAGLVDEYPAPVVDPVVEVTPADVKRLLGIDLTADEMADLLRPLEFVCTVEGDTVTAKTPPHRLDIGEGVVGKADLIEEIARMYGYDRIPSSRLNDELPVQSNNPSLEGEERLRDLLVSLGLQEIMSYRLTSPEREARLLPQDEILTDADYVRLLNPIAPERSVMRRSLLACVLEAVEKNHRQRKRLALFEIGPVFLPQEGKELPLEKPILSISMTGLRNPTNWDQPTAPAIDFFDLKGVIEAVLQSFHVEGVAFEPSASGIYHPGKSARILANGVLLGELGELHPAIRERYDLGENVVVAAVLEVDTLLNSVSPAYASADVPVFPPMLEDLALVVDEDLPAEKVAGLIRQTGGKLLAEVTLFDIYRGGQIGEGKKSLAYNLVYQAPDRTLSVAEVAALRQKIIKRLDHELGAKLRS
ncbi:MAG: phenylalanine--tRNA ligase subunit beta [Anaerolineaceae bacterium]